MKKSITLDVLNSSLKNKFKLLVVAAVLVTAGVQAADKHAQGPTDWITGTWYDAATGGNAVTAPTAGDNVFTNGFAITISDDVTCDNLTFTNVVGQIGIAAGKTLTVSGKIDYDVTSTADAFSTSDATSILKLTGAALTTSPYIIITDKAIPGIRVKNLVIQAADSKTYQFGETGVAYTHGTGKFTVKNGTTLEVKTIMTLGQGTDNELIIEEGATVNVNNHIKGTSANFSNITKATINGTLSNSAFTGVKDLVLGTNGKLISGRGVYKTTEYVTFEGWWGTAGTVTAASTGIGTPNSVLLGSNSTIEFNRAGDQRLNGIVPANGTPAAAYSILYANLKLSGSGTKTIQSNLVISKNLEIANGVTMTIPAGIVVVNTGSLTGTAPVPAGALITASSNDNTKGTISATIAAGEVTLVAAPISGFMFDKWTEGATELSALASYTFTPSNADNKVIVANFVVDPNTSSATTTKANAYITVVGKNMQVIGEVNAIEIYNAQGKQIQKLGKVSHVNGLSNGIYIVKIQGIQDVTVQKVCVK